MDEKDKVTKKKLRSLQNKWIKTAKDESASEGGGLTMDFSELEAADEKPVKEKKKKKTSKKKAVKEILLPEEDEEELEPHRAPAAGTVAVDYDLINEMVQRAVNMEIERAIRELKAEIRENSENSKKELYDQLKLEIETVRQEVEFSSRSGKRQKGLFERF